MTSDELFPSVSDTEYQRRYRLLWSAMAEHGLDAMLVYGDSASSGGNLANIVYLTGYKDPLFSYILVLPEQQPLLMVSNPLYLPHALAMADVDRVEAVSWNPGEHLVRTLRDAGVGEGRIGLTGVRGIHKGALPHDHVRTMTDSLTAAEWVDTTSVLHEARRLKSEAELGLLRKGARFTDATVEALARDARAGMSEYELAGIVHGAAVGGGGDQRLTFLGSTSMSEPELVFPRQSPSHRRLSEGDVVLSELSTGYGGYAGQIHRAFAVGEPTPEYRFLFDVARDIYDAALDALGPGRTDEDLRTAVRPIIKRAGVWTMDALLHGWGLSIEPPRIDVPEAATIQRPQEPTEFAPGMTMVLQPHVLADDQLRGIQLGSLIAITDGGAEPLQHYPMEWITIPLST